MITVTFDARDLSDSWATAMSGLAEKNVVERLWSLDHTVVQREPDEVANRLGWLSVMDDSREMWPNWALAADRAVESSRTTNSPNVDDVVVLGMGGSSLFPDVLARTFESGDDFPSITVLDSTDPTAIRRVADACDPQRTIVVGASKSGTTLETRSHLSYFWERYPLGRNFMAITDPGSELEQVARQSEFRFIARGVPEIGGRFSALSAFGMLPAALMGLDGVALLDTAHEAAAVLGPDTPVEHHAACQLGALIAVAAQHGRDKLTFVIDEDLRALGSWLEQLIAESTGKHGRGILPVVGEDITSPDPDSRLYVLIGSAEFLASKRGEAGSLPGPSVQLMVEEPQDLGAEVFLWEFATAVAGIVLEINPFDQPDVESAKKAARDRLTNPGKPVVPSTIDDALARLRPGDALVIGAFVDPAMEDQLQRARLEIGRRAGVATTLGIGPRFLHSTGQLHKGGPDRIVMLQVLSDDPEDIAVPYESYSFGQLKRAQADGDLQALNDAGKRAVRVPLEALLEMS